MTAEKWIRPSVFFVVGARGALREYWFDEDSAREAIQGADEMFGVSGEHRVVEYRAVEVARPPIRAFVLLRPCGHRIPIDFTGNEFHGAIPAACPECGDPPRTGQIFVEATTTGDEFKIMAKVEWP